jgi:hypothetical protein
MTKKLDELAAAWDAAWPDALEAWSKFTRLRPPALCRTKKEARGEGLTGSFAMIRLSDQAIVVSLPAVVESGVEELAVEVLAHEIGHHVLAPATLTEHARMIARMRRGLPTLEAQAPMVANLYTDLLINDRLQRAAGLAMDAVYRALPREGDAGALWRVYLRIYEVLWSLPRAALGGGHTEDREEGDAWLGARLVRSYARDWLDGSGRFAALMLPYLLEDKEAAERDFGRLADTRAAGAGGSPAGLVDIDPEEEAGNIHPAADPALGGEALDSEGPPVDVETQAQSRGQRREPFEYGEILRAAGIAVDDHEAAVRYYAERARQHLVRFPSRPVPERPDPLPEGLEAWSLGDPLDELGWFETVTQSPHVIPGVTTVKRVYGTTEGNRVAREPIDLDLYVDSSGSMADPRRQTSFPTLAGAIVALSALRAGARVQATLWSGARQFQSTDGFVRDERAVLRILTGYFGGGTAFPLHVLRDTFAARKPTARPAHILVVSDDGVSTMFDAVDERGTPGWEVARAARARARGGGTLVLNLWSTWESHADGGPYQVIRRARDQEGWAVDVVTGWDQLIGFARAFSRRHWSPEQKRAA